VTAALRAHWPEYVIEAAGLAAFMISACAFGVLIFHPDSPAYAALGTDLARRAVMGVAMGATAIAIIYSPWGRRSGAHVNPATTLAFLRLGKIARPDAAFYVAAQFIGAVAGVAISFLLMSVVLAVSSSRFQRLTGLSAGFLVAIYITFESPISGMSMNPARSFGSALFAGAFAPLWIYFIAPLFGMQLAAVAMPARAKRGCAKLDHPPDRPCIFCGQGRAVPHPTGAQLRLAH